MSDTFKKIVTAVIVVTEEGEVAMAVTEDNLGMAGSASHTITSKAVRVSESTTVEGDDPPASASQATIGSGSKLQIYRHQGAR